MQALAPDQTGEVDRFGVGEVISPTPATRCGSTWRWTRSYAPAPSRRDEGSAQVVRTG